MGLLSWRKEDIFFDGDEYFAHMLADIEQAKNSVDLETYIFSHDELGEEVVESLEKASRRGVRVRVLIDGVGSWELGDFYRHRFERAGIYFYFFHPLPWYLGHRNHWYNPLKMLGELVFRLTSLNRRNHRKVCLIDNKIAWVGSMNISKSHLLKMAGEKAWRDTGVRIEGEEIFEIKKAFNEAWPGEKTTDRVINIHHASYGIRLKDRLVRLNYSRNLRRYYYKDLLFRIKLSTRRVWITNPYFIPDSSLISALKMTARRGVDVRILMPKKSDIFLFPLLSSYFYRTLIESGARIYEYTPRVLHAKTLLVDNWAIVGSSNLNRRSLFHDLEVDVVLTHRKSKEFLEKQFLDDLSLSKEVSLEDCQKRSFLKDILGRGFFLLKHWF